MNYNFDEVFNRKGTDCSKWDYLSEIFGRDDLISMWVADMDFRTPPFVIEAIEQRLHSGVLGYTRAPLSWYDSICRWVKDEHGWDIGASDLLHLPGIVRGIAFALQQFTAVGDKVMVTPPVYHPFFLVSERLHREVVYSPLVLEDNKVRIDFDRFEQDVRKCKLFIFCNPHNPGGRVWTREELQRIAEICERHHVLVLSDEIHCDLTLPPYKHICFATINEWARNHSITFMAPSKTFNMPGLSSSFCIIQNEELREQFHTFLEASELEQGNVFAYVGTAAAFSHGKEWLEELKAYLIGNIDFVQDFLKERIPAVTMIRPQASYLIYLNCKNLHLRQEELVSLFVNDAHLALNDGTMFGKEGEGYMRMNIGCPKTVLQTALRQLEEAINKKF